MELAIGIIVGIVTGVTGFWIFNRKQKAELDSLRTAKIDLTAERDNAEKDKADLENRLGGANAQIDDLKNESTEKTAQIATLEGELTEKTTQVDSLTNRLQEADTRISTLEGELTEKTAQIATLEGELTEKTTQVDSLTNRLQEADTRISTLEGELTEKTAQIATLEGELTEKTAQINNLTNHLQEANVQISTLEGELTEKTTQVDSLTNHLQEAGRQIDTLTNQLKEVSESNENALQLLHLFELSSQLTALALYSEVSRATNLGGKNKELYAEYEKLYAEYQKSLDRYNALCEEVERRAKRRLVRSSATTVLSLLPGVGIIQIVGDLAELANFVSEIAEGTADVYDMLSVAELSVDLMNLLVDFIDLKSIESLQPEISSDQGSEKVKQKYQSIFKEVFAENLGRDNKEPDASDFNNFLKAMIQRMKEFVDSMPESERRNALNRLIGNFGQFGIALYNYHESPKPRADRSLPAPKN